MKVTISNTKEATILFVGDLLIFLAALWLTLTLRYGEFPDSAFFMTDSSFLCCRIIR